MLRERVEGDESIAGGANERRWKEAAELDRRESDLEEKQILSVTPSTEPNKVRLVQSGGKNQQQLKNHV